VRRFQWNYFGDALERTTALVNAGVDAIVLIRLTGTSRRCQYVEENNFPNIDVIVGNIATPEAALFLVETAMM
jgi:IMP dehydrogenase